MQENQRTQNSKIAFFLPNIFTALNMACGFVAIMFALKGRTYMACMALFFGAIFDSVDGRVARLTGTTSAFGEQFDSMSDLVSFGVAPALVFYMHFLTGFNRLGMVAAFLFVLCGALRLARFNANIERVSSDYFQGAPIPMAALALIGLLLFTLAIPFPHQLRALPLLYIAFYSVLMISNIPFPSFKNSTLVKTHKKQALAIIFGFFAITFLYEEFTIMIFINLYTLGSLIYYTKNRKKFRGIFQWKNEPEEAGDEG